MKKTLQTLACLALLAAPLRATEEAMTFEPFGKITLYHAKPRPAHVVLFVSGDGGWNLGVVDMARELATLDALVAGFDITHYLKESASPKVCFDMAGDFERLTRAVEEKAGYPAYVRPVLVGYSSGATMVYAALVQGKPGLFQGAMSLGFCPDLLLSMPICKGQGLAWDPGPKGKGVNFRPAPGLEDPWIAFQGLVDQVCNPAATIAYVKKVRHATVVSLPKVGHGYSVPRNWLPQFKAVFNRLTHGGYPAVP